MAKEINILIRAKDFTRKAWKSVKKGAVSAAKRVNKAFKGIAGGAKKAAKTVAFAFLAAGAAIVVAMKRAQEFNKQMAQVATLADVNMGKAKKAVRGLSVEFGLAKDALTKGLYDALSAGVPKENVFDFMRVAAKAAIAGAATTAESVDVLTTAMNSFKIPASDAESVADALFTTVRLGKTTLAEIAASFAQVGPLAASSGVDIKEMLAAVATLTKQGTPTAQAMTQIRGAIIAMNRELGDGWSATMTLQEGFQAMSDKAGGSNQKLKDLTGRVEGMLAILATTGQNAAGAADDLDALTNSAGGLTDAFSKVEGKNPLDRVTQGLDNMVRVAGDAALMAFGGLLNEIADAAGNAAEKIATWTEGENFAGITKKVETLTTAARDFIKMLSNPIGASKSLGKLGDVLGLAFEVGAKKAVNVLVAGIKAAWAGVRGKDVDFKVEDVAGAGEAGDRLKAAATDLKEYVATVNEIESVVTSTAQTQKNAAEEAKTAAEAQAKIEKGIADIKKAAAMAEVSAGKKRIEDAEKLKDTQEQIADVNQQAENQANQDRIKAADEAIKNAQKGIADFAKTSRERNEEKRDQKRNKLHEEKIARIRDKVDKKRRISANERKLLGIANLKGKIEEEMNAKETARKNLEDGARHDAQMTRERQLTSLQNMEKTLKTNLELAQ